LAHELRFETIEIMLNILSKFVSEEKKEESIE
jgi:hypothetical protein